MSKYLFISAHTDDVELSCGGTIAKLKEQGHSINLLTFSRVFNDVDLYEEWKKVITLMQPDSHTILDFRVRYFHQHRQWILQTLVDLPKYDYIFTHSATDTHQDHAVIGEESLRAFKGQNLITYKGEWNGEINKNYFVQLDERLMYKKMIYLDCYKSQEHRPYMGAEVVYAIAMNNGLKCKTKYAEAFETIKLII
jgi:LmbE family N-acetylglucosaminyl deacetylase